MSQGSGSSHKLEDAVFYTVKSLVSLLLIYFEFLALFFLTFLLVFYFFTHLLHVCHLIFLLLLKLQVNFFHKGFIFIIVVRGYKTKVHSLQVQEPGLKPDALLER